MLNAIRISIYILLWIVSVFAGGFDYKHFQYGYFVLCAWKYCMAWQLLLASFSGCQHFGNWHFGHILESGKSPFAVAVNPTANCDANSTAASSPLSLCPSMAMAMAITKKKKKNASKAISLRGRRKCHLIPCRQSQNVDAAWHTPQPPTATTAKKNAYTMYIKAK